VLLLRERLPHEVSRVCHHPGAARNEPMLLLAAKRGTVTVHPVERLGPPAIHPPPGALATSCVPKRCRLWVATVLPVVILAGVACSGRADDEQQPVDCRQTAGSWLDTLQGAFYREYRGAAVTSPGYIEAATSEGTAYYVAVKVKGVAGTAVFGTSDPPLQSDPGLIAAANQVASQLSDLGADIPEDSPAGMLLLDGEATSAAESC
jgi:hypothetical protein